MTSPTQSDLIDLLRRTTDDGWLTPLLADTDSATILNALAKVGERVGLAIDRCCANGFISMASLGTPGNSTISSQRLGALAVETLLKGTLFQDDRGAQYALLSDIPFPIGNSALPLVVSSVRLTESVNTVDEPGMFFSPAFNVANATNATPIEITTAVRHSYLTGDRVRVDGVLGNLVANGLFTITVIDDLHFTLNGTVGVNDYVGGGIVQPAPFDITIITATPVEGGAVNWLAVLAKERGQSQQSGERNDDFRARVRNIEDVVSPNAISAIVSGVLQRFGVPTFALKEPFELGETPALKQAIFLETIGQQYCDADYLDNPNKDAVSRREATAWFEVDVNQPANPFNIGAFLDGPATFLDFSFSDAVDFTALSSMTQAMRNDLDVKKAAAVQYDIMISLLTRLLGQGIRVGVGDAIVFTLTPPVGKVWALYDCFAGVSITDPKIPDIFSIGPFSQHLHFTFDDATTFDLPVQTLYDVTAPEKTFGSDHFTVSRLLSLGFPWKPIVSIEGRASSDGTNTMRLVASFWVVEITL